MLLLTFGIIKSGVSNFYYFKFNLQRFCLFLQFCLSLLGKGKCSTLLLQIHLFSAAARPQPWENIAVASHCKEVRNSPSRLKKNNSQNCKSIQTVLLACKLENTVLQNPHLT